MGRWVVLIDGVEKKNLSHRRISISDPPVVQTVYVQYTD
jgi:hypothetical protein